MSKTHALYVSFLMVGGIPGATHYPHSGNPNRKEAEPKLGRPKKTVLEPPEGEEKAKN